MMKQQWKWRQLVSITLFFFIISFSSSITALTSNNLPDKNEIKSALNALNKKVHSVRKINLLSLIWKKPQIFITSWINSNSERLNCKKTE